MALVPAALLAAQALAAPGVADSFTFEILTGPSSAGWSVDANGAGTFFDRDLQTGTADPALQQPFSGPAENYAYALKQTAKYRALARPGDGCPVARSDVFGFRLSWVEAGARFTATFTDSCGGIPVGLDQDLRPVGERIDALLQDPDLRDEAD